LDNGVESLTLDEPFVSSSAGHHVQSSLETEEAPRLDVCV